MSSIADELHSHYVLFSCEGTAEGVIIEQLYESNALTVPESFIVKDPITFRPFTRLRKAADIEERFCGQNFAVEGSEGLLIARIVDSGSARFALSRVNREVTLVRAFITAPEIEMLAIHAEGAYEDWCRKSRLDRQLKPSNYCVKHLGLKEIKRESFLKDYWSDADKLVSAIKAYQSKLGKRKANEFTLASLLDR